MVLFLLGSCGPLLQTGEGAYSGTLIDVEWGGLFFKTCEIEQRTGMASRGDRASSLDKDLCDQLKTRVGKPISIKYTSYFWPGFAPDTPYIIQSVE